MKTLCTLILVTCYLFSVGQDLERKVFISAEYTIDNVILSRTIELEKDSIKICDNSYSDSIIENEPEIRVEYDNFPTIKKMKELTKFNLINIQDSINNKEFCDYLYPIRLDLIEKGELYRFQFKRIQNCYPENAKIIDLLDIELEILFESIKNYAP